jgi:type III secretion system (T3SS) inner membrane Yop/YscD-like protein
VDAIDLLILALRLVLVALLYLFLVVVLRMAYGATGPSVTQRLSLRVVEPGASSLQPGEVFDVGPGATLGRGGQADVVLADTAVSAEHARVDRVGRHWMVTDLGSTNGTRLNNAAVKGRAALNPGDVLSLGTVRLEVVAQ